MVTLRPDLLCLVLVLWIFDFSNCFRTSLLRGAVQLLLRFSLPYALSRHSLCIPQSTISRPMNILTFRRLLSASAQQLQYSAVSQTRSIPSPQCSRGSHWKHLLQGCRATCLFIKATRQATDHQRKKDSKSLIELKCWSITGPSPLILFTDHGCFAADLAPSISSKTDVHMQYKYEKVFCCPSGFQKLVDRSEVFWFIALK